MKHVAAGLVLLLALGPSSGCQRAETAQIATKVEPWPLPTVGSPEVTLKRWSVLHRDNDGQIYYVRFISPERIDDENVRIIEGIKSLRYLGLAGTQVTDEGLRYVSDLANLEYLALPSGITDAGLVHLYGLKKLKLIDFGPESGVNLKGVEQLKEHLPKCKMSYRGVFSTQ